MPVRMYRHIATVIKVAAVVCWGLSLAVRLLEYRGCSALLFVIGLLVIIIGCMLNDMVTLKEEQLKMEAKGGK